MKEIILGITGSIAAYKAADIAIELMKCSMNVNTIMTLAATKFITPLTLQSLTKNKVYTNMFDDVYYPDVCHISIAQRADCLVVVPLTTCQGFLPIFTDI